MMKYGNRYTNYNGQLYRSILEARFAKYLDKQKELGLVKEWFYEPEKMIFAYSDAHGKRVDQEYWPDFLVRYTDETSAWFETKGYITDKDIRKWKLFRENRPDDVFVLVCARPLRPGISISHNKYNRIKRIVNRIFDTAEKEFKALGVYKV